MLTSQTLVPVSQIKPGELFRYERQKRVWRFGFMCAVAGERLVLPLEGNDRVLIPLAQMRDRNVANRRIVEDDKLVSPLGTHEAGFAVHLPELGNRWSEREPAKVPYVLVVDNVVYFQGLLRGRHCFADPSTGVIETDADGDPKSPPAGRRHYVTGWHLVTTEPEPQIIL
jgi:hypothetical protein